MHEHAPQELLVTGEPRPVLLRRRAAYALFCAAVAAACYVNTLQNGFCYDDHAIITENPQVTEPGQWGRLWLADYWQHHARYIPHRDLLYRPVSVLSYRLNYVAAGLDPWSYHLVNILLHAVVTVLLFHLLCVETGSLPFALVCGVLFAAMPIHTEAVSNVVGRAELLAALFTLLALVLLATGVSRESAGRRVLRLGAGGVAAFAAVCAKETGAAVFVLVPLFWCCGDRRSEVSEGPRELGASNGRRGFRIAAGAVLVFALAAYLLLRWIALDGQLYEPVTLTRTVNTLVDATPSGRALGALQLWGMYWAKTFWPAGLTVDYSLNGVQAASSLWDAHVLLGGAVLIVLVLVAAAVWRHGERLPTCWLAALLICYLPASNTIVLIKTFFAERLWYLPSIWLAPLICWSFWRAGLWWATRRPVRASATHVVTGAVVTIAVVAGAVRCWLRNAEWKNDGTVFAAAYRVHPDGVVNLCHYGRWLTEHGRIDEGLKLLRRAVVIDLGFTDAQRALGEALLRDGQAEAALEHLAVANAQIPHDPRTEQLLHRAQQVVESRRGDEVRRAEEQVRAAPDDPAVLIHLADVLADLGRYKDAAARLLAAESRFGSSDSFEHRLAVALVMAGRREEAIGRYRKLIEREPQNGVYLIELAMVLLDRHSERDVAEAKELSERAYAADPRNVQVRMGYAEVLAITGHRARASAMYRELADELPAGSELGRRCRARAKALGG